MRRASQILPYRDGRGRSIPPGQPSGDQLVAAGRKEGNDERQHLKAAKQVCKSSHFKDRWKLVIGQSNE